MEQIVIGIVRSPHGLAGNFKVESTSGESDHYLELAEITLRKDGTEKIFTVESVEGCTANLIMKCAEINTPEEVRKYAGAQIVVPFDKACPLRKGEYYIKDLEQCTVVYKTQNGERIKVGTVQGVMEGGGGYLLEIALAESFDLSQYINFGEDEKIAEKGKTRFVPFKNEFVGKVDIARKSVELMHLWILE